MGMRYDFRVGRKRRFGWQLMHRGRFTSTLERGNRKGGAGSQETRKQTDRFGLIQKPESQEPISATLVFWLSNFACGSFRVSWLPASNFRLCGNSETRKPV